MAEERLPELVLTGLSFTVTFYGATLSEMKRFTWYANHANEISVHWGTRSALAQLRREERAAYRAWMA